MKHFNSTRYKMRAASFCFGVMLLASSISVALGKPMVKDYETEKTVYKLCFDADAANRSGNYAQAVSLLTQAAASDPTSYSSMVHLEMSEAYKGLKNFSRSLAECNRALKFDPENTSALYGIGLAEYQLGDYEKAIAALDRFVSMSNDQQARADCKKFISEISVFKNLTQSSKLIDSGHPRDALRLLEKAASFDPTPQSATIHANLAYVLRQTGDPERAIIEGEKALRLDPSDKNCAYTLGLAYQDLGKFEKAISWLRRYVEMENDPVRRQHAADYVQELSDDRVKNLPPDLQKPDYLDQMKKMAPMNSWQAERMPLKVYVKPGSGQRGYKPVFKTYVTQGLDTWCAASGKKLNYKYVDSPSNADITVEWTESPILGFESGRERQKAGVTLPITDENGNIKSSSVKIRTVLAFDPKQTISDKQCSLVTMHEIGHALGIFGHSTLYSDLMYFGSSSKQSSVPTKRDKATLARLYKDFPVIAFTPKTAPVEPPAPSSVHETVAPPIAFLPPKPSDTKKLMPPMFVPPPIKPEREKLVPPMFVPPPISQVKQKKLPEVPLFVPPPVKPNHKQEKKPDMSPLMFTPPPK